jgi:hypothetical protein
MEVQDETIWLMRNIHLGIHILGCCGCMILAPLIMCSKKGSARHLRLGKSYLIFGYTVAVTSLIAIAGGLWVAPIHTAFLLRPYSGSRLVGLRAGIATTAFYIAALLTLALAGNRLKNKDFTRSLRPFCWYASAAIICLWGAVDFLTDGLTTQAIFAAANVIFILMVLVPSFLLYRRSAELGWRFAHAMSAISSVILVYRNLLAGSPLAYILPFFPTWLVLDTRTFVFRANCFAFVLFFLIQLLILYVFEKRSSSLHAHPSSNSR